MTEVSSSSVKTLAKGQNCFTTKDTKSTKESTSKSRRTPLYSTDCSC